MYLHAETKYYIYILRYVLYAEHAMLRIISGHYMLKQSGIHICIICRTYMYNNGEQYIDWKHIYIYLGYIYIYNRYNIHVIIQHY